MASFEDFTTEPGIATYLKKISKYKDKISKKFFAIYDKIDNMSQFRIELKKTVSDITDDPKEKSKISTEFNVLRYVIQMMTFENIKNEEIDEFFGGAVDNNSDFSKYFKSQYNEEFIKKIKDLTDMDRILNKHKFSILNFDYDINLRSKDLMKNEKPIPVISLHLHDNLGNIEADCSMKDIDYLIEELNKLKEEGEKLVKANDS